MHDVGVSQGKSIPDVETEGDTLAVDGRADVVERVPRLQRLEADDNLVGAERESVPGAIGRGDARVQPERCKGGERRDERILGRPRLDRIEIGRV